MTSNLEDAVTSRQLIRGCRKYERVRQLNLISPLNLALRWFQLQRDREIERRAVLAKLEQFCETQS